VSAQIRLDAANLSEYLGKMGLIPEGEAPRVEAVGDGNINWVRRVRTAAGSMVVKQARPALERFPEYRVSTERIVFEARFYETAAACDVDGVCPRVLAFDPQQRVLLLEDLGEAERLDAALARGADVTGAAATLAAFLGRVHASTRDADLAARFANDEMRSLHGDHVFLLPYRPNAFPISPRVAARAGEIQADAELVGLIDAAHARYLAPGTALVHGDVQAANVLLAGRGPVLLDAEIAHVGDPAFDLGQLLAHLLLPLAARGRADAALPALRAAWCAYRKAAGAGPAQLCHALRHAGIELLRRTIGAARVPAVARDDASLAVIDTGLALVRSPSLPALGSGRGQ
jgi:5-methylthioribose kinase